ncbi:hypothetical protein CMI37_37215 [Candidatus Pacearchaeota archaeon]|nr:hypothetical protein [Candidatus Pacearchaeota archaeon]|tara:strand:+ start:3436 stop:3669 length:234 start_codon:yes stop_codon:yes gene_type:complete
MNLKAITAPFADKIEDLAGLVQEMKNNIEALVEVNQKQFVQLEKINGNLIELVDNLNAKKDICRTEETAPDSPENPD